MKIREILNEYNVIIPQPKALKIDLSAYDFQSLMKEFRASENVRAAGDRGLIMFYSEQEMKEFENFLKSRKIGYENIEKEQQTMNGQNTVSPVAKIKPNKYGI